jgi:uncharacterized protein (PEP-CTERM system associated)
MSAPIMAITGTRVRTSLMATCAGSARRVFPSSALQVLCQAACGSLVLFAASGHAETWRFEPSIGVEETLTNNVNLAPYDTRRGDLVTQLTPGFSVAEKGAHTSLSGFVALPILLYARTGAENNKVEPQANLLGSWEVVDRLFFVESAISVTQQYLTPFGARSESLANATDNRYTSQTYRVTPYIKGNNSDYTYELRDDNIWTKGNASGVSDTYTNDLAGTFQRDPRPWGWAINVDRTDTKFQGQADQSLALARALALYQVDPQVQLSVDGGYEHNDLLLESKGNTIYGVGAKWRPSERTNVDASWEHRFFGASYNFVFANRGALSVWSFVASRNITTYPQQLAALPGGTNVAFALDQLLFARIPDPTARQNAVNQFIRDRGLPPLLSSSVNLYTQQITLQEALTATAGILGARNSVFFSAYRVHQEPVTGSGAVVPAPFDTLNNNTQYGGNIVWTHTLTPLVTFTSSLEASRTVLNDQPGVTNQGAIRAGITSPVAPLTSVYGGIRFQILRSTISTDYNEFAVFVGLTHRFN